MKILIIIIIISTIILAVHAGAMNAWYHPLFVDLRKVASSNRVKAVGDNGKAWGVYQIHPGYVRDVNRVYKTRFTYEDRLNPVKAHRMVRLYLDYWGRQYVRKTGRPLTLEVLARIHNGGPEGWRKPATAPYWLKVRKELRQ